MSWDNPPALVCYCLVFLGSSETFFFFFNTWKAVFQYIVYRILPLEGCWDTFLPWETFPLTFSSSCWGVPGIFILKTYCVILTSRFFITFPSSTSKNVLLTIFKIFYVVFISSFKTPLFLQFFYKKELQMTFLLRTSESDISDSPMKLQISSLFRKDDCRFHFKTALFFISFTWLSPKGF